MRLKISIVITLGVPKRADIPNENQLTVSETSKGSPKRLTAKSDIIPCKAQRKRFLVESFEKTMVNKSIRENIQMIKTRDAFKVRLIKEISSLKRRAELNWDSLNFHAWQFLEDFDISL